MLGKQGRYHWMEYVPKVCREECFRIGAQEAQEQGIGVSHFRNVSGLHALCVCPQCGKRARFLYRPPIVKLWHRFTPREKLPHAGNWACARCHNLTFRSSQRSGTVEAMQEAREQDREAFLRLFPDGGASDGVSFENFQKWKYRSYNRNKAKNRFHFGKIAQECQQSGAVVPFPD